MAPWVEARRPEFGPGVRERMEWARTLPPGDVAFHRDRRATIRAELTARIGPDTVFLLPTTPAPAPPGLVHLQGCAGKRGTHHMMKFTNV